jgi:hypothetical protein
LLNRVRGAFLGLVLAQTAHSVEEYLGRLWESFPPAAFVTSLVSSDPEVGFLVINAALVGFGVWCFLVPVRRAWPSTLSFLWFWVILETINGIGHLGWSTVQRTVTPGTLTAPLLLILALYLGRQLRHQPKSAVSSPG